MSELISRETLKKNIDFEHICKYCNNHCGNVCDDCPISEIEKKIDKTPTIPDPELRTIEDLENNFICGYRVKDLILFGKLFHDNAISREDLINYSDAFLAGYQKAYEEITESIEKTVNSFGINPEAPL